MANGNDSAIDSSNKSIFILTAKFFGFIGEISMITVDATKHILQRKFSLKDTIKLMASIGVNSMPIVVITTAFSGAVLALYTSAMMVQWGVQSLVGGGVTLSVTRELAPVLTGVVVAARAGSAIAAEIGTMKVTEQIDALKSLGTSPIQYLVVPRFLALVIMLPILTMLGMVIGSYGGYIVATLNGVTGSTFISSTKVWLSMHDITMGLLKTIFFGAFISIVGCQQGLSAKGGAAGVGKNTMNSVVISMIMIYITNYFLAQIMFGPKTPGF
ncbi:MAG: MlaE family ABC transporter permease [Armatimonadota bacterium]